MADDDTERYKEMASPKQGVYKHQPSSGTEGTPDQRHPQQLQLLHQQLHQQQQQQAQQQVPPVRPSRRSQHNRRLEAAGGSASSVGIVNIPAGSRGPRSLYLHRDGDSFGFTLRHFIVYPPDSITANDGRHAAVGALREPMETIFVKQVYENSPAHRAGLHHGDRLVSVNGCSLNGKTYAQVVQLIQNSPPYLHLLVVPKEDDVLQKFFPETAHNPETNQRPKRYASPESFTPRRQQPNDLLKYRPIIYPPGTLPPPPQQQQLSRSRAADTISWRSFEEPSYSSIEQHRSSLYQPLTLPQPQASSHGQIQGQSPFAAKSSEQLYDYVPAKSKEALNYRPILSPCSRASSQRNRSSFRGDLQEVGGAGVYAEPYEGAQRPRAQPQVPTHAHARKMGRRASEGSNISDNTRDRDRGRHVSYNDDDVDDYEYPECSSLGTLSDMVVNSSKMKSASHSAGCRLSLDAGRRESTASLNSSVADSKDSLSSYDSASTLTGQDTDDSIIMTRFRKSFEKKEEFLKRPSQPIGWKTEDCPPKLPQAPVIPREFYGRPQKLQKEWPPIEPSLNGQESPSRNPQRPTHQNFQRVKIDIDNERDYLSAPPHLVPQNGKDVPRGPQMPRDCNRAPQNGRDPNRAPENGREIRDPRNDMQMARNRFYEGAVGQSAQFVVGGLVSNVAPLQRNSNVRASKDKNSFVTTLSRIHESAPICPEVDDDGVLLNGSASLPGVQTLGDSGGSNDVFLDERRYPVPPNLQIVSRRTKQFESGRPLPEEEDGSLSDRTNFYRSELSRLSSKRVVPNVAVRKREFETLEIENNKDYRRDRDLNRRPTQRESRSLDNSGERSTSVSNNLISGNRAIPIGSSHLHCIPPNGSENTDVPFESENAHVPLRVRSNSAESWTAVQHANSGRNVADVADEKHRTKVGRQDSYVSALKSKVPVEPDTEEMDIGPHPLPLSQPQPQPNEPLTPSPVVPISPSLPLSVILPSKSTSTPIVSVTPATPAPVRPNQLTIASPIRPATSMHDRSTSPVPGDVPPQVVRRSKNNTNSLGEEDRATRRVSYLKATWGDRMHVESDLDLSDTEISPQAFRRYRRWKPPRFPKDIKPIRSLFEEPEIGRSGSAEGSGPLSLGRSETPTSPERETAPLIREGALSCKFMELEGKRANDRSWHKVWAVLKGPHLFLYKDRHHHHQSPMGLVETDQQLPGGVDMRYSVVNVADDYTKRKNVLRISAAYPYRTELLLQADSPVEMADWVRTLQEQTGASTEEEKHECMSENKQAVPQQIPAATSVQVQGTARLSPQPSNKSKLAPFRNRSPTGQSPKSKTWRGRVVKQFKKLNQGSGSPSSPTTPEKLTFGVPLEHCQKAIQNEFLPRFVEMCTEIIEERGLEVVGIYRVPGNNAAVSALTEELNKGINLALQDVRSSDTNVVSSLLKSFFRKLPDSLLTSELYPQFIDADKIEDPKDRLQEIKRLINDLPDHQYATLKHLILHLKKVVDNSEINKMEARNLAIVFGPTLVRNVEDNMVTMVTDMSHQCRIVESLLIYAEWFFSDDDAELLTLNSNAAQDVASVEMDNTSATVNNTLLLGNICKIEGKTESAAREKKDIMSSIISAANRKIQRKSRKPVTENSTNTKEEVTTPTSESKDSSIVNLLPQPEEQKQPSLDSEESSSSDNVIPDDPLLMTYPQLEAKTSERVEKFRQETMAMLQQKRRSDSSRSYVKPYLQNGADQPDNADNQTSSDLLATITSVFDNKIKALQSPTHSCLTVAENIPYADESPDVTLAPFDSLPSMDPAKPPSFFSKESRKSTDQDADKMSPKTFRNPSLHKNFSAAGPPKNIANSPPGNLPASGVISQNLKGSKSASSGNGSNRRSNSPDFLEREKAREKSDQSERRATDELNELCRINFTSFILNKELKCSSSDSKLKRSESLNKSDNRDLESHGKLKRSVSLNRAENRLKRSDSLTKYEKTESNINLRRELADDSNRRLKKAATKLKRKNGMPERSIKRRHTVGGTKDFDRVHWLDNRLRYEAEESANEDKEKTALRSSSPDLTSGDKIENEDSKLPLESHI